MNILEKALDFANKAHEGQTRKLSYEPYILHPAEVAVIVASMTDDIEVMAAGLLHDTVEDCGVSPDTIKKEFGERIYELVKSETEDKQKNRSASDSWQERKEKSLEELKNATDKGVKILWLADKLANMRSFHREFLIRGADLWNQMNQHDVTKQQWYYEKIAEYVSELSETCAYKEYIIHINVVFKGEKENAIY